MKKFDIAIIGAGTSGLSAYREAIKATKRVALIDGGELGTTCARVGCMPSKLLIAPSEIAHRANLFAEYGVEVPTINVDGRKIMDRVKNERDRFVGFVKKSIEGFEQKNLFYSNAKFIDDNTLILEQGKKIYADRIIIATGSTPRITDILKSGGKRVITSDDLFYLDKLPSSIAVVGAGVIGLELSQALSRLNVKTKLFGRNNKIALLSDPEVRSYAVEFFKKEMDFVANGEILSVKEQEGKVLIEYKDDRGNKTSEEFEYLLAATGRTPNLDKLSLSNTSLKLDKNNVPIFNSHTMQCGRSHIFIAGDVNNKLELLHEAADEGRIAGENAVNFPKITCKKRKTTMAVVFSDPQIAIVGKSYKELTDTNLEFVTGQVSFENQGRARVMLVNHGLMKLYGDPKTELLLGGEFIGPSAEHIAHLLAWSMQSDLTISTMLEMPFYHPVIEEGLRTALRMLRKEMGKGPMPPLRDIDCGPGS